jgi:hypothetical protein
MTMSRRTTEPILGRDVTFYGEKKEFYETQKTRFASESLADSLLCVCVCVCLIEVTHNGPPPALVA